MEREGLGHVSEVVCLGCCPFRSGEPMDKAGAYGIQVRQLELSQSRMPGSCPSSCRGGYRMSGWVERSATPVRRSRHTDLSHVSCGATGTRGPDGHWRQWMVRGYRWVVTRASMLDLSDGLTGFACCHVVRQLLQCDGLPHAQVRQPSGGTDREGARVKWRLQE